MPRRRVVFVIAGLLAGLAAPATTAAATQLQNCPMFPADNVWNADISALPVHPRSADWLASMNTSATHLHPDFGPSYGAQPVPYGIPFTTVTNAHPTVNVTFQYASESDPGRYPFGSDTPIEGGQNATGDRHAIMLNTDTCRLYELFDAQYSAQGSTAGSGATWDSRSDALRPSTWTSADAAGLPILPGLLRPDEVASGSVTHAIRFTAQHTDTSFIWPARHQAGSRSDPTLPPMGARFRLDAGFDMSSYRADTQVVLRAMQHYGLILADNGSNWFFSGSSDNAWDPALIDDLKRIPASAFSAIDESSLMVSPDSGAVNTGPPPRVKTARLAGGSRYGTAGAIAAAKFPTGVDNAVLVSGLAFPDALAGAYLASTKHAAILLTDPDAVPAELTSALQSLKVRSLTLLGGVDAISASVEHQLSTTQSAAAGQGTIAVTRTAGASRYETMAAVNATPPATSVGVFNGKRTAILTSGLGFADALAASAVAYKDAFPIILTDPSALSAPAAQTIRNLGIGQLLIMGGTNAVSSAAEQSANADGAATVARFAGADRQDTAQQLAAYAVGHLGFSNADLVLARGDDFADALAGGPYAGDPRPILLTVNPATLGTTTQAYLSSNGKAINTITALGGSVAINDATLLSAARAAG